jgi:hypothetical protein
MCVGPLEAKARACLKGLELALQHSQLPIIIDTDCVQLISMVQGTSPDRLQVKVHISILIFSILTRYILQNYIQLYEQQITST